MLKFSKIIILYYIVNSDLFFLILYKLSWSIKEYHINMKINVHNKVTGVST